MNPVKVHYEHYLEVAAFSTKLMGDPGILFPKYYPWLLTFLVSTIRWMMGYPNERGGHIVMNGKWAYDHDRADRGTTQPVTFWYNNPRDAVYVKLTWGGNSDRRISSW